MLVFSQKTGYLLCILLYEAYLTNIRTAAAGAVVAKYLAPKKVKKIGIFGAGVQGRMQLEYLRTVIPYKEVYVWGLNSQEIDVYKQDMESKGYGVQRVFRKRNSRSRGNRWKKTNWTQKFCKRLTLRWLTA